MNSVRDFLGKVGHHVSPRPDSYERVLTRARRRALLRRLTAGAVGLTLTAGIIAALAITFLPWATAPRTVTPAQPQPDSPVLPSLQPQRGSGGFHPQTYTQGDSAVMPITFPDGTAAEITYSSEFDLSAVGMNAVSFASPIEMPDCAAILYARYQTEELFHGAGTPLATYQGATGEPAELWEPPSGATYPEAWLVFRFGAWRVGVPVQGPCMEDDALSAWAVGLRGHETESGFLILEMIPPLRPSGAGDPDAPGVVFEGDPVTVQLFSRPCAIPQGSKAEAIDGKEVLRTQGLAEWCASDSILVRIEGKDSSIEGAVPAIDVRGKGTAT
jgi:hypothetical protein